MVCWWKIDRWMQLTIYNFYQTLYSTDCLGFIAWYASWPWLGGGFKSCTPNFLLGDDTTRVTVWHHHRVDKPLQLWHGEDSCLKAPDEARTQDYVRQLRGDWRNCEQNCALAWLRDARMGKYRKHLQVGSWCKKRNDCNHEAHVSNCNSVILHFAQHCPTSCQTFPDFLHFWARIAVASIPRPVLSSDAPAAEHRMVLAVFRRRAGEGLATDQQLGSLVSLLVEGVNDSQCRGNFWSCLG